MRRPLPSLPLIVAMLATLLVGCTRPPELIGIDNPEIPVASVADLTRHRIFITTTRQASEVSGALFSSGRAPELGLAAVDVTIPPTHVTGELERPSRLPPDPRTEFTVVNPVIYRSDARFIEEINRELATRPPGERKVLLFVHGYNNTASDALLRLAQFVEDTDYQGVPVLFTWASAARTPF
jgi:esterase/lipase superfamily enzyme